MPVIAGTAQDPGVRKQPLIEDLGRSEQRAEGR
jgi:hypothetical protein